MRKGIRNMAQHTRYEFHMMYVAQTSVTLAGSRPGRTRLIATTSRGSVVMVTPNMAHCTCRGRRQENNEGAGTGIV